MPPRSILLLILAVGVLFGLIWKILYPLIFPDPELERQIFEEEKRRRHQIGKDLVQEYQKHQLKDAWRR